MFNNFTSSGELLLDVARENIKVINEYYQRDDVSVIVHFFFVANIVIFVNLLMFFLERYVAE